ncbi:MAG: DNA repair protein RecO [Nevskiales bacterium]|nr:DNA repair protein RecO [Nevskiales bacterium]
MKRVQLEPAWLLSQRPYLETAALLEVFTVNHGRVGLVARNVRTATSKRRGVLQPFRNLLLSWTERGELGTLTAAEAGPATMILSGQEVFLGWYLNELMLRLLARHDAYPRLYRDYASTLEALSGPRAPAALRIFEKHLLMELGYGLHLPTDLEPEAWYDFDVEAGPHRREATGPPGYRGSSLLALAEEKLVTVDSLRDARRLLRTALASHLTGRELQTPGLLRTVRAATGDRGRESGVGQK